MRELPGPWSARTAEVHRHSRVGTPAFYYDLLAPHAGHVDIWQTTYEHVMGDVQAIVEWVSGTGLRPYLDVLEEAERASYLERYSAALEAGLSRTRGWQAPVLVPPPVRGGGALIVAATLTARTPKGAVDAAACSEAAGTPWSSPKQGTGEGNAILFNLARRGSVGRSDRRHAVRTLACRDLAGVQGPRRHVQCTELVKNTANLLIKTQLWGAAGGAFVFPTVALLTRRRFKKPAPASVSTPNA